MRTPRALLMASSWIAIVGCGGAGDGSCEAPAAPAVFELGSGETCFERLKAGQTVPQIAGPQGGFHIWAGLGCGDCGDKAIIEFGTQSVKTKAWLQGTPSKQVVDLGQGAWGQHAGLTAFLPGDVNFAPDEQLTEGTHVLLAMRVLGENQAELHAAAIEVVLGDLVTWSDCSTADTCGQSGFAPCCTR
jgi:hypothetical protein